MPVLSSKQELVEGYNAKKSLSLGSISRKTEGSFLIFFFPLRSPAYKIAHNNHVEDITLLRRWFISRTSCQPQDIDLYLTYYKDI